jgi:DNA invertase Pin-like site-specific DNA recombinase
MRPTQIEGAPPRAAIYARVSTTEQETENQVAQLKEYVARMGWTLGPVLRETEHGWEPNRAKIRELLDLAHRREIDIALVWALDRFSRQGVSATLALIDELHATGVRLWSYREPFLRETDPKIAELLLSILAWAAKQEHVRISERTKAGLELVRRENRSYDAPRGRRPVGRRPRYLFDRARAVELRSGGLSWNGVLKVLGLPRGALTTLRRVCQNGSPGTTANSRPEQGP